MRSRYFCAGGDRKFELLSEVAKKRLRQAVKEAGQAPSSKERAKIQHMLMPIANHIATRLLYTEVSAFVHPGSCAFASSAPRACTMMSNGWRKGAS